ncbi:TetR/AcrR family transcriptional regulator [Actinomadura montaniterrae]|uniref:TetR/AcrR family transcriptional regulator n=1 Tax=Actinomadura montaniterrae TaxID=1803903 RepID=A0A6L3VUE5_9ACTN|nr:TetR/AcrR family transcriptional regulator [Actinomadura montaniterrae]KAB2372730.1 TetR/AcrR family transcriptional regulator [Actinomadura montaniterrae]
MPKLWSETVAAHRDAVREAILDAAAALVAAHGPTGVTMSRIAKDSGIGRATLYKYFPDVDAILRAWHERQIDAHLERLYEIRDRTEGAGRRLEAVLAGYAAMVSHRAAHDTEAAVELHRGEHVAAAHRRLHAFVRELIADAAAAGAVRQDVPAGELAAYCLHALAAAGALHEEAAVHRLVRTTLTGLQADC